jgi:predicted permease
MRRIFLKMRRRNRLHRDLETELAFHRDMALAHGNPIPLGNTTVIREQALELWRFMFFEDLWRDLVYAIRGFGRSPALVCSALLSLGLGIGANTAIFSLIDTVLLRMLPVEKPEELEKIAWQWGDGFTYPTFQELRRRNQVFSGMVARCVVPAGLVGAGRAERGVVEMVSGNYFSLLGVRPILGRALVDDDNRLPMGNSVAVLSFHYWRERLAADASVVGKIIRIDNYPFTIIGVAPPAFFGVEVGSASDVWVPIMMRAQEPPSGPSLRDADQALRILGRRLPAIAESQAQAALSVTLQQIEDEEAERNSRRAWHVKVNLEPGSKGFSRLRGDFENPLYVLMAVVALVLLIACVNIANLLLARSAARRKEIAVRLALGAGRARLVRQLFTESVLLGVLGGALGIAFAAWGVHLLLHYLPATSPPIALQVGTDARTLAFAMAISIFTGLFVGLAPALQATRPDLVGSLEDARMLLRVAARRFELGKVLVVLQVALSLLLLVGAGLLIRSLQNVAAIRLGLDTQNVLMASIDPSQSGYTPTQSSNFCRQLEARLRDTAGVRAVGTSLEPLLGGLYDTMPLIVPGRPLPPHGRQVMTHWVGGEFFRTTGITIVQGRDFGSEDTTGAPAVAIINETAARYFFGDEEPIGRRIPADESGGRNTIEIIGIASDSKYTSVREDTPRILYFRSEQGQTPAGQRTIYLRSSGDPTRFIAALTGAVHDLDRNLPVFNIKTFAQQKAESLVRERLLATLSGFFGSLALLLAAVGLYGVTAYTVLRRTHEIGVRMSLGADRLTVIAMVLRGALAMTMAGLAIGLALSQWLSRWLTAQLYGVGPSDPVTVATACVVLTAVSVLAAAIPAWKASRVAPMVALRYE